MKRLDVRNGSNADVQRSGDQRSNSGGVLPGPHQYCPSARYANASLSVRMVHCSSVGSSPYGQVFGSNPHAEQLLRVQGGGRPSDELIAVLAPCKLGPVLKRSPVTAICRQAPLALDIGRPTQALPRRVSLSHFQLRLTEFERQEAAIALPDAPSSQAEHRLDECLQRHRAGCAVHEALIAPTPNVRNGWKADTGTQVGDIMADRTVPAANILDRARGRTEIARLLSDVGSGRKQRGRMGAK